jgi:hypothetical protein
MFGPGVITMPSAIAQNPARVVVETMRSILLGFVRCS